MCVREFQRHKSLRTQPFEVAPGQQQIRWISLMVVVSQPWLSLFIQQSCSLFSPNRICACSLLVRAITSGFSLRSCNENTVCNYVDHSAFLTKFLTNFLSSALNFHCCQSQKLFRGTPNERRLYSQATTRTICKANCICIYRQMSGERETHFKLLLKWRRSVTWKLESS